MSLFCRSLSIWAYFIFFSRPETETFSRSACEWRNNRTGLAIGSNWFFFLSWTFPTREMRSCKAYRFRRCSFSAKLLLLAYLFIASFLVRLLDSGFWWSTPPFTFIILLMTSLCSPKIMFSAGAYLTMPEAGLYLLTWTLMGCLVLKVGFALIMAL